MSEYIKLLAFLLLIASLTISGIALFLDKISTEQFMTVVMSIVTSAISVFSYEKGFERGYKQGLRGK